MRLFYKFLYRPLNKLLHKFDIHYMPKYNIEGDTQIWCQWCGARHTVSRLGDLDCFGN